MAFDLEQTGKAIGTIIGGIVLYVLGKGRRKAADSVVEAQARTDVSISDAEAKLYELLRKEVTALSEEVGRQREEVERLRAEVDRERTQRRRVEDHVRRLESMMRNGGLDPPAFDFEVRT